MKTSQENNHTPSCCHKPPVKKADPVFLSLAAFVAVSYGLSFLHGHDHATVLGKYTMGVFEIVNTISWGVALGIVAMGFLSRVPREFIMSLLGTQKGVRGIFRAVMAGVLLDLCSHGILMVGAKLYERGATIGQVVAFLLASPWNSFSLTLVLIALIGLKWTLVFVLLSMLIGVITGIIFDELVRREVLPTNPNTSVTPAQAGVHGNNWKKWIPAFAGMTGVFQTLRHGWDESESILRWILLGVIIAAAMRSFIDAEVFKEFFGPSLMGLAVTLLAATVIEVCSQGSAPIAADILKRGGAVGNSFVFLMAGVATDYTTIMVLKETTKSWKIALFLPLIAVPQIVAVGWVLNVW